MARSVGDRLVFQITNDRALFRRALVVGEPGRSHPARLQGGWLRHRPNAALFLALDEARFFTGAEMVVDGKIARCD